MVNWQRVWIGGTVCLIAFISYSSQIFVVWPWYGEVFSIELLKLLVPFNLLVLMVWWNYALTVKTPPGAIPHGWRPDPQSAVHIEVKRGNHQPRYCKQCGEFKPPRAHHCRHCGTCVLKLDHHCPWVGNCVGFYNHGHFVRFLLWVDIATSYHLLMMVYKAWGLISNPFEDPTLSEMLFLIFNFATGIPVWMCVGLFSIYHLYLTASNTTTIERWEKDKVATLVRRGKIKEIKYPYNVGIMANWKSVLGSNPLLWLWPKRMEGDGLSYAVNPDAGEPDVQYMWPPRDPTTYEDSMASMNRFLPAGNPFTYGEGFNPNLRASSAARRAVEGGLDDDTTGPRQRKQHGSAYNPPWETELDSEGNEPDSDHYDSDGYEYSRPGDGCLPAEFLSGNTRVRRGSEGWEVRPPAVGWAADIDPRANSRGPQNVQNGAGQAWNDAALDQFAAAHHQKVWEQPGRYRTYDPDGDELQVGDSYGYDSDSDY